MSIRDDESGWVEPTVTINGRTLGFAEAMSLRVAVSSFRLQLHDRRFREGLGASLADGYDRHLRAIDAAIMATDRVP